MFKNLFRLPDHPFNRATKLFGQIRHIDESNPEYWSIMSETLYGVGKLCSEAIQLDKYDGDAHILLANIYLLAALYAKQEPNFFSYDFNIARSVAVIWEWKTNPRMYSKEKENGEKIFKRSLELVGVFLDGTLDFRNFTDPRKLHKDYYIKAIRTGEQ